MKERITNNGFGKQTHISIINNVFSVKILQQLAQNQKAYKPSVCPDKLKTNPNVEVVLAGSTVKSGEMTRMCA